MKKNIFNIVLYYLMPIISISCLFTIFDNKYSSIIILLSIIGLRRIYEEDKKVNYDKRSKIFIYIISILISCFITFGTLIDRNFYNYIYSFFKNYKLIIFSILSLVIIISKIIGILYSKIETINKTKNDCKYFPFISFLIMVLCWVPYLYNYYPALMSPDSLNQYGQASGVIELSNHHPIIHTYLIKVFYIIGKTINNANMGMMFYSLFQIVVLALIFTYILSYFYKKQIKKYLIITFLLFYSILPVFGYYSVTIWKDVLFGAFSTLLIFEMYKLVNDEKNNIIDKVLLVITTFLTCTFRTNGLLAVLLLGIIMFIVIKNKRKCIALFIGIPVLFTFVLNGPIYNTLGIKKTEFTENAGIMLRQIYGTIYDVGSVDSKSTDYLSKLVDLDEALEVYTPYDDHIKLCKSYNNEYLEKTKKEFIITYFRIGIHNIRSYVRIYLKSTYGVWYPEAQGYIVHNWQISDNSYGLKSKDNFDNLQIGGIFNKLYNMPIIKYFMSEAFYIWIYLIVLGYFVIKKNGKTMLSVLLPLLVFMTIMVATPLSYQPRYMFIMHCSMPLVLLILFLSIMEKEKSNEKKRKKS